MTSIGNYAFQDCDNIKNIEYNCNCTTTNLFQGITSLQKVKIGDKVTTLYNGMFSGCTGLQSVTLGAGLKYIRNDAFKGCAKLDTVTCRAENPPYCYPDVFANVPLSTCTLEVPMGSVEAYKATAPWNGFANIVEFKGDIVEGVSTADPLRISANGGVLCIQNAGEAVQATLYNTDGKQVEAIEAKRGTTQIHLAEGQVYLVKVSGRTFKVAM